LHINRSLTCFDGDPVGTSVGLEEGDVDGPLLGLFEGDWLGLAVGFVWGYHERVWHELRLAYGNVRQNNCKQYHLLTVGD